MSNEVIFYTQIASIVVLVVALFVLYRVLVSQKDSTIELLREKNQFLTDQLERLRAQSPEAVFESILGRYDAALDEIKRRDLADVERKRLQQEAVEDLKRDSARLLNEVGARTRAPRDLSPPDS